VGSIVADDCAARRGAVALLGATLALALAPAARAFPPYRSTDAETAAPGVVEARVGLVRVERDDHDSRYTSPLLRLNLGVARGFELVSELEYDLESSRLGDGALGLKWASEEAPFSVGVETLALLPVSSHDSGAGVESQLLVTWRFERAQIHANAGGFYDARPRDAEQGWRASLLAEAERGRVRFGTELFAKQIHGEGVRVEAGPGVIWALGPIDVRTALHVGLTSEAPDLRVSLWLTWQRRLW
jgi:hypothetical protein